MATGTAPGTLSLLAAGPLLLWALTARHIQSFFGAPTSFFHFLISRLASSVDGSITSSYYICQYLGKQPGGRTQLNPIPHKVIRGVHQPSLKLCSLVPSGWPLILELGNSS